MSIEIDILNGDASWPIAEPLHQAVWGPELVAEKPWAHVKWANADLRVLIETPEDGLVCHVDRFVALRRDRLCGIDDIGNADAPIVRQRRIERRVHQAGEAAENGNAAVEGFA